MFQVAHMTTKIIISVWQAFRVMNPYSNVPSRVVCGYVVGTCTDMLQPLHHHQQTNLSLCFLPLYHLETMHVGISATAWYWVAR